MRYRIFNNGSWSATSVNVFVGGRWTATSRGRTNRITSGTARWPSPIDDTAAGFRPVFKPLVTLEVGAGREYETISAAIAAGASVRGSTVPGPDNRIDILVHPGIYRENLKLPYYSSLIGVGSPEDVAIMGISNGPYVGIVDTGGGCFIENVSIIHPAEDASWAPKYPVHAGHSGTLTFVNCILDGLAARSGGGGTALGVDGGWSGWIIGYKSRFNAVSPAAATNSHGPNSGPGVLADYWIDCEFNGGIGFNSIDSSRCELHILGSTTVDGSVLLKGDGAVCYIDEGVFISGATPGNAIQGSMPPVLVDGMNPTEWSEYYGG